MDEVGIDIRAQRSSGFANVEGSVDLVVTLCQDEVCPVWLGATWRVHWELPDPAGTSAPEERRLSDFRGVRDELRRRLGVLFGG
jgi:arsenate reductase